MSVKEQHCMAKEHDTLSAADHAHTNLVGRVWAEFQEMPGLCLTIDQAQRLFGIEAVVCREVLEALVQIGELSSAGGRFLKTNTLGCVARSSKATRSSADYIPKVRVRVPEHSRLNGPVSGRGLSDTSRRVLVVDDDPDIVRALTMRLAASGLQVLAATEGVAAMSLAVRSQPDVIILDIGLPGCDGHAVAKQLRSNAETVDIPMIFLTSRSAKADFKKAQAAASKATEKMAATPPAKE